jgi:peptidyl-prolyl cis-trans isomerase D
MLQQMREQFRYLKWLLLVIIFMFIWWAFATWGGGATRGRQGDAWAARVNGVEIPIESFQSAARQLDGMYQSVLGEQYAQQRAMIHIGRQAIDRLVEEELVYQEALRQGIGVTPQEIAEAITRDPNFQENGKFIGLDRYRNLFRGNRISIEDYEGQVRRGLLIEKFKRLVVDAVNVSDSDIEQEFLRRNVKATVAYLVADPAKMAARTPSTETQLQRYYEEHKDRYSRGEGRTGVYVLFTPAEAAASEVVSDDDVAAAYERFRTTRYETGEQRCAAHILIKVADQAAPEAVTQAEKRARDILKKAKAGEDFAALARKYSEDSSAASGGDLGCFPRGQMVKEFEDSAFSLPVGGVSDLVRTRFGFHIIKVKDQRPPHTTSLQEAKEGLRQELKLERARGEVLKRAGDFSRAAAGGKLETVAKSQGLTIQQTGEVHQGDTLPGVIASQPVVARMLSMAPGTVSDPVAIPSGQVVLQVTGTTPPATLPFKDVRARVQKDDEDARARQTVIETIRSAGRSGGLDAVARALKAELKTQSDLTSGAGLPGIPPDASLEKQIETLTPGAIGEPVSTSAGIVVLSVKERRDHREDLASQKDSIGDGLLRQRQERLYRALVKRLREGGRVEVNGALVDSLDRA